MKKSPNVPEEKKWLFVFEDDGRGRGWRLRIDSKELLSEYLMLQDAFRRDMEHLMRLKETGTDRRNVVSHTEFGYFIGLIGERLGTDVRESYGVLSGLQRESMEKVLDETGAVYVNRKGGFHGERRDRSSSLPFVRRSEPEFPRWFSNEIRVKRFDGGRHWYAYIGDMQVRDGDVLKWDTYEEALAQAERFAADKKRRADDDR